MFTEILMPTLADSSIRIHALHKHSGGRHGTHIHDECEMEMILSGKAVIRAGENEYILHGGDICFINGRVPHSTDTESGTLCFILQTCSESSEINSVIPRQYISRFEENSAFFPCGTETNLLIRECLDNIIKESSMEKSAYGKFIKADVMKIFAVLYRENILKDPQSCFDKKTVGRLLPVLDYIDTHYGENITLDSMSRLINVDKTHFCRIFKKAISMPFTRYLNLVRICKAEKLLLSTDMTVAEISEETGFSSSAYFAEIFKSNMHCSPCRYKKIKLTGEKT